MKGATGKQERKKNNINNNETRGAGLIKFQRILTSLINCQSKRNLLHWYSDTSAKILPGGELTDVEVHMKHFGNRKTMRQTNTWGIDRRIIGF